MANQILNDNFLAHQAVRQREPAPSPDDPRAARQQPETRTPPSADRADIGPARQRLSQESKGVSEPTIGSADEARRQIALLKEQLSGSPAAALKAHGAMNGNAFEAAMARPIA